ncbi:arylalkylamine N-acetyltransferase-like 2 [Lutzomyia longipalpis]|uniref:arylalkylamine N-acetyltransferase-like 2 n=1 Tax=Lutzomyia longipalpis TaxID=7200 RepID=UPI00248353F6|nr:arylalkylamine N-acetyltransferase-like 2 [Lutzomyia longipalpis]
MANTISNRLILRDQKILLRVYEKSDYDKVLLFLRQYFYPFDQSSQGRVSKSQSPEDEEVEMRGINSGVSVLAVTDDDKQEIIGASLAKPYTEEECRETLGYLKQLSALRGYPNDLEAIIFAEEMKIRSQIWRRHCINEALYLSVMAIKENFQRLSLGRTLMQKNLDYATELGYSVAFGLSVTPRGIRLIEKFNFKCIYCINFVDYKDYRGLSIYNTFQPHLQAKVFAKFL